MPLRALLTLDGRRVPLAEVNLATTAKDYGLPPADVAAVIHDALHGRADVGADQVTASQAGSGARQLYLEATVDYAREPKRQIAALRGSMRHAVSGVAMPGLLVEQRVVAKGGRYSMKFDSFVENAGQLRDQKYPNVFKVLMILKNGVEKEARDYVLQLNLGALILKQQGKVVNEIWLDFSPTGVGKLEKQELETKYGITDPTFIPIPVPFLPEADVWDAYERLYRAKKAAHITGTVPPICEPSQTWGGKKCIAQPGGGWSWCAVAAECHALAQARGEAHPRDKQNLAGQLTASIAAVKSAEVTPAS